MIERDQWSQVEAHRVAEGLQRARFWERVEPNKHGFWDVFDGTVLAHYPECRFKIDDQLTLGEFSAASG